MYFPNGWPKLVNLALPGESAQIHHVCCDALKIIVAAISDDFLGIWYANPLLPISYYKRSSESLKQYGVNKLIVWKPDSRQIVILTTLGVILLFQIDFDSQGMNVLTQIDPPHNNLRRDSAELFIKENIPRLSLREKCCFNADSSITTLCCISLTELLIATKKCELLRLQWLELEMPNNATKLTTIDSQKNINNENPANNNESSSNDVAGISINLRRIHFYVNQSCHLKICPPIAETAFIASLEYSPFIGGCAAVFSDNRAAFLMAMHLVFLESNMHGFWVPDVEDATVCNVNHKFRLLAYGRGNSDVSVFAIEDTTGGLEFSHRLSLNSNVMPGCLGAVCELKWSPDGCVLAVCWQYGGIALWSTFGALLMSSFSWDFGLRDYNPLQIKRLEWSTEGYQLFMICHTNEHLRKNIKEIKDNGLTTETTANFKSNTFVMNFIKSTLTMNPCMTAHPYVLLQGDDTIYLNQGDNLEKVYPGANCGFPNNPHHVTESTITNGAEDNVEVNNMADMSSILSKSKYWTVLQLPQTYAATNWPIRYSAVDAKGSHVAVAGRTGFAHYSLLTKKWKLFGNESQEKDFVVSGGLLWWQGFIIMGCYSLIDRTDEIRCYPDECKLDNEFGNKFHVRAPVMSMNMFNEQLIALTADGVISLFFLRKVSSHVISVEWNYEVDVKNICIHPACIVTLTVCNLRNDATHKINDNNNNNNNNENSSNICNNSSGETIIVNVCGRILMIQRDIKNSVLNALMASCLASCVECFWLSNTQVRSPMADCLWLYSGAHGMRVWLPILPPSNEQQRDASERLHTFMSKRIMLSFSLKLYPLVILFDNVIVLGVENETTLYASEAHTHFSLPFCVLERKSQVYLHRILRKLIKRNLGYSAWEIAKSCRFLPYFPHALELLLHEVLEEEATSKEPIPDALLPSILDFIREFPVYLQTIVQCARKTEIALWPYLFSMAGKPKDLFQQCLVTEELETAASYLIILQNLEPSIISKQYATLLLDIALEKRKWDLAKDLIRFLKAIDPNEIDSPRSSMVVNLKIAPQTQSKVNKQNPEVFNLILGTIARERSFSTTQANASHTNVNSSVGSVSNEATNSSSHGANSGGSAVITTRRKSERSISTRERKEIFCIDSILQRHASKMLQQYKLIDLGYMSASLDFHLVTWLSQEAHRAAKLDNFVVTLTALHEELHLPSICANVNIDFNRDANEDEMRALTLEYAQLQTQFLDSRAKQLYQASSQTSESGYFSLALGDTPLYMPNGIKKFNEQRSASSLSVTDNKYKHNCDGGDNESNNENQIHNDHDDDPHKNNDNQRNDDALFVKTTSNSQMSINKKKKNTYGDLQLPQVTSAHMDCESTENRHTLPEKIAIQIRYLLQLFIEAKCTDYALILSILLHDTASIGRIINMAIRSESLSNCKRIENTLKQLTLWSLDCECMYRTLMITLQPYIYLLEQYVASNEKGSPVNLVSSGGGSPHTPNDISLENGGLVIDVEQREVLCSNGVLHANQPSLDHRQPNFQKQSSNGKITWPSKAQIQPSVSSISAPVVNKTLKAYSDQYKRNQASGCLIM